MKTSNDTAAAARRQKIQLAMLGALMVLLIALSMKMLAKSAPSSANAGVAPANAATAVPPAAPGLAELVVDWPAQSNRDPFYSKAMFPTEPVNMATQTATQHESVKVDERSVIAQAKRVLSLQATLQGTPNRALINGSVHSAGDEVAGFVIEQISVGQVAVKKDGVRVVIEMPDPRAPR
jgi:hypothetical protein